MDILIKSYNRPHYLDRCITSVKSMVKGYSSILVLDDGTPEKYLEKIKQLHPEVIIKKSANYARKSALVIQNAQDGTPIDSFNIPTALWKQAVQSASDYFIITEDDVWFTKEIDAPAIIQEMKNRRAALCKLGWLGNKNEENVWASREPINELVDRLIPNKLTTGHKGFMSAFFENRYKLFTLMYYLRLVDNKTRLRYWSLNSIMMGLYEKKYWLATWQDSDDVLNERIQLINAATYYHQNKNNRDFILRLREEAMRTTFQSSATNSYHKYGIDFDVNRFNHLLNEAWYRGEFDIYQNYPNDFSADYLSSFLENDRQRSAFREWSDRFRTQYRELGAAVD